MKKILYIIGFLAFINVTNVQAQSSVFNLTYNMSFPAGEFQNYISRGSFRGFGFEGRGFVSDDFSVGGLFSWAVFNEKTSRLEQGNGIDVSGVQFRYVNAYPLAANFHYWLGEPFGSRIYFGAGLGAYKINQRTEIGLIALTNDNWHFGFYPEIGTMIPVGTGNTGINVGLKYHYAVSNSNADAYGWISLDIGFAFIN